jgi:hypothetical protein
MFGASSPLEQHYEQPYEQQQQDFEQLPQDYEQYSSHAETFGREDDI